MKNKLLLTFTLIIMLSLFINLSEAKVESNNFFNISFPDNFYNISLSRFGWSPTIPFQVCNTQNKEVELRYETILHRIVGNFTEASFNSTIWEKQTSCRSCISNITFNNITDCDYCGENTNYVLFNKTILSKSKNEHTKTNQTAYNCKDFKMRYQTIPNTIGEWNLTMLDSQNNSLVLDPFFGNTTQNWTSEGAVMLATDSSNHYAGCGVGDTLYWSIADNATLYYYNVSNDTSGTWNTNLPSGFGQGSAVCVNDTMYLFEDGRNIYGVNITNSTVINYTSVVVPSTLANTYGNCHYYRDGIYCLGGDAGATSASEIWVFWLNNQTRAFKSNLINQSGGILNISLQGSVLIDDTIISYGGKYTNYAQTTHNISGWYNISNNSYGIFSMTSNIPIRVWNGTTVFPKGIARQGHFNNLNGKSFLFGGESTIIDATTQLNNETFVFLSNYSIDYYSSSNNRIGMAGSDGGGTNRGAYGIVTLANGRNFGVLVGGESSSPVASVNTIYTFQIPEESPSNNAPLILNISRMPNTAVYGGSYNFTALIYDLDAQNMSYVNHTFLFANGTRKEANMSLMFAINSSANNYTMPYLINLTTLASIGNNYYWINASDGTATVNSAITTMLIQNNPPTILNLTTIPNSLSYNSIANFSIIYNDIENEFVFSNLTLLLANNTKLIDNLNMSCIPFNSTARNCTSTKLFNINTGNESLGIHRWWVNASDGFNVTDSSIQTINITDFVKPDLTIINPTNSTYVNTSRTSFNYSAIDNVELSKVWWQFNKNGTNVTLTDNFTIQFDSGSFLLEIWANDSSNNINYSNVSIQVNTQSITSSLISPPNNTILSNSSITFNCSASTVNLEIINATFYFTGENGTFMPNETVSLTGTSNSTLFSRNITQKNYKWNCLFWSNSTFSDSADSNNTIIVITNTSTISSINSIPLEPKLMNNVTLQAVLSSGANTNISWVNFTLIAPNGTRIYDHINASLLSGNTWNSSINKLDKNGTWKFFVNASNNYGFKTESTGYITITDVVSVNPGSYSRALNVKGENWTFVILSYHDTDETLSYNITFENNLDPNHFNTSINTTNFVLTNSNTQFNPFGILVQINTSANILNGTYNGNITIRRVYDNRLIRRISVTAGVNPPAGLPLLSDAQFRVCSVNSPCDSIYFTDSGPGATYQNFWKFNNTGGYNLSDCKLQIWDSSLNNDITTTTFAGFVLSPSTLVVEPNNGSSISLYKSSLNAGKFYGRLDLNCSSDNFAHRTTLSSINSSQMPIINITVLNPSGGGGGGGGGAGGGGQPAVNLSKEGEPCIKEGDCQTGLFCNNQTKKCVRLILCGDGTCDSSQGESSLTCPKDCPTFLTSKGFWGQAPVIWITLISMGSIFIYMAIKGLRKK